MIIILYIHNGTTVFTTFWPLGFIAFGGPQAHVAILRDHLVDRRDWLDEDAFMELFAIGQVCLS
jgi:chromate transporter